MVGPSTKIARVLVRRFRPVEGLHANPAEAAGVRVGDVIEAVNGQSVASVPELLELLKETQTGVITLTLSANTVKNLEAPEAKDTVEG